MLGDPTPHDKNKHKCAFVLIFYVCMGIHDILAFRSHWVWSWESKAEGLLHGAVGAS